MSLWHLSIRDLFWLTVVVALAVAWWEDHRRLSVSYGNWNEQIVEAVKDSLEAQGWVRAADVLSQPTEPSLVPQAPSGSD